MYLFGLKVKDTKVNLIIILFKEEENIFGLMGKFIKDNGKTIK